MLELTEQTKQPDNWRSPGRWPTAPSEGDVQAETGGRKPAPPAMLGEMEVNVTFIRNSLAIYSQALKLCPYFDLTIVVL